MVSAYTWVSSTHTLAIFVECVILFFEMGFPPFCNDLYVFFYNRFNDGYLLLLETIEHESITKEDENSWHFK